jgi:hypothetical protein
MAAPHTSVPDTGFPLTPPTDRADTAPPRTVAAVGLLGVALIHLLDLPSKLAETPYLGVAYLALIAASVALAAILATRDDRRALLAAGALAAAVALGYALSRTVGLPLSTQDIGAWGEPLGVASLFVEGTVIAAVLVARTRRVTVG